MDENDFNLLDGRDVLVHLSAAQSAYLMLARHLAVRGHLDMEQLAADLEMMAATQDGDIWREDHQTLADALRAIASFRKTGK